MTTTCTNRDGSPRGRAAYVRTPMGLSGLVLVYATRKGWYGRRISPHAPNYHGATIPVEPKDVFFLDLVTNERLVANLVRSES